MKANLSDTDIAHKQDYLWRYPSEESQPISDDCPLEHLKRATWFQYVTPYPYTLFVEW
jgi:hypothetical protein